MERLVSSASRPGFLGVRCLPRLLSAACGAHQVPVRGLSAIYTEEMRQQWLQDPRSVHESWDLYFRNQTSSVTPRGNFAKPTWTPPQTNVAVKSVPVNKESISKHTAVAELVRSYRVRGHKAARLDPLGISTIDRDADKPNDLSFQFYRFNESDLDRPYLLPENTFICDQQEQLPLREIIRRLEDAYCQTIGIEYMYINNNEKCKWIRERFENPAKKVLQPEEIQRAVQRLIQATNFEEYLKKKWGSEKRFGLEGCEVLIPAMKTVIDTVVNNGIDTIIMGMPHRGRLNVLANVIKKPLEEILCQFDARLEPHDASSSGDVKYHLGTCIERLYSTTNSKIKFVLMANPSHLEAVNPVVQGRTRAEQVYRDDKTGDKVMSILLHGDAAFAGQGVVFETFHLSNLPAYTTQGTVHIICNNQIGFTTDPRVARSSAYCTDVARVVNAPIFHVNADDVEAVLYVAKVAAEWRCKFKQDVVIDLVGYRRHGHNEADEPAFTQPNMYEKIKAQTPVLKKWTDQLLRESRISSEWLEAETAKYDKALQTAFENSKTATYTKQKKWLDSPWKGFFNKPDASRHPQTGVPEETLQAISARTHQVPDGFALHRGLKRTFEKQAGLIKQRTVDWALAESMAFGSILLDGYEVRLSGQDVERGTFTHRHHVLHDQEKDLETYVPLNQLHPTQGLYTVCNSSLSEFAVLGFELGYSQNSPDSLVLWEAQFGDFANNAQCIIDQFITSGERKWVRQSGLVLLLPHGYEGQGPEHSSARLERFLQMSAEDEDQVTEIKNSTDTDLSLYQLNQTNWIIAHLTTPANYFHILRRQVALPFRKPLIMMSPKSLLRSEDFRSSFNEMIEGTSFQRIYPEQGTAGNNSDAVKKLLFCSGKTYYDLRAARAEAQLESQIAIVRIEQLSPFPFDLIQSELAKYKNAGVCFAQEEHKNMGPYSFCKPRLAALLRKMNDGRATEINYAGRDAAAAAATGKKSSYLSEHANYMRQAMKI